MATSRIAASLIAALAVQGPFLLDAVAQLPLYTLPKSDFVWHWGELNLERRFGTADIDIRGGEAQFRCELTARLRPASPVSVSELRDLEMQLSTRLDFIYAVSETMNYLEYQRALDWATLNCEKFEAEPASADERAERESAAREKMLRELERRRARQQRSND